MAISKIEQEKLESIIDNNLWQVSLTDFLFIMGTAAALGHKDTKDVEARSLDSTPNLGEKRNFEAEVAFFLSIAEREFRLGNFLGFMLGEIEESCSMLGDQLEAGTIDENKALENFINTLSIACGLLVGENGFTLKNVLDFMDQAVGSFIDVLPIGHTFQTNPEFKKLCSKSNHIKYLEEWKLTDLLPTAIEEAKL